MIYFAAAEGPVPRDRFLGAMRRVAASVTVVTTYGESGRHGATVSAFTSLSADPPAVLVCLRAESRIAGAVTRNGRFCVNVLPEGSDEIAARFAGARDREEKDRFAGLKLTDAGGDCPALAGATVFSCAVFNIVPHSSHLIVIGHVIGLSESAAPPLAYLDGRYHCLRPNTARAFLS